MVAALVYTMAGVVLPPRPVQAVRVPRPDLRPAGVSFVQIIALEKLPRRLGGLARHPLADAGQVLAAPIKLAVVKQIARHAEHAG